MKILLVEDDEEFSSFMGDLLVQHWGHEVTAVFTGKSAVQKAGESHYDLVLLDIFLLDGLGHEFIEPIRAHSPGINIIAMTGHNSPDLELTVRAKGVSYYMIKPFELASLKTVIEHLATKSSIQDTKGERTICPSAIAPKRVTRIA